MKKSLYLFLFILVFACSKSDTNELSRRNLEEILGVAVTASPLGDDALFFEDVDYGTGERQQLDVLLPRTSAIRGVVLFFHGGGFTAGDKAQAFDEFTEDIMQSLLDNKVAVVTANYSFLTTSGSEGVISALEDGALALRFLENHLDDLGIPSNKIILAGVSAGAGIAQWNAFKPQRSEQIQAVVALAAQSTYDLYEWENIFPGFQLDALRQMSPILQALFLQFYGGQPSQADLDAVDYRSFMDASDPALYVYNFAGDEVIDTNGSIDFDVLYHSYRHSDYLRAKAIAEEIPFSGIYQERPEDFVLRILD